MNLWIGRCLAAAVVFVLLIGMTGCRTDIMKSTPFYEGADRSGGQSYTGDVADRVNLWPVAYVRDPVLSVLWPMISITDTHAAFRPVFSKYRQSGAGGEYDEYNFLWPYCQFDFKHRNYRIPPFFWGDDYFVAFPAFGMGKDFWTVPPVFVSRSHYSDRYGFVAPLTVKADDDDMFCVWPLFFTNENDGNRHTWFGWGTAGLKYRGDELVSSWFTPFWWVRPQDDFFATLAWAHQGTKGDGKNPISYDYFPPLLSGYGHDTRNGNHFGHVLCGLGGWNHLENGEKSDWAFPLYYRDPDKFVSLPWISCRDGEDRTAGSPLALSWYRRHGNGIDMKFLLGLAAADRNESGWTSWVAPFYYSDPEKTITPLLGWDDSSSWMVPLYYHDSDMFLTPLGGWSGDDAWIIPLYYRNKQASLTPLCGWTKDSFWAPVLPLFYSGPGVFATPLVGWTKNCSWAAPLYWADDDTFVSLPYIRKQSTRDHFIVPLLSRVRTKVGGGLDELDALLGLGGYRSDNSVYWAFPLFYRDSDDFCSLVYGSYGSYGSSKDKFRWWGLPLFYTYSGKRVGGGVFPFYGRKKDVAIDDLAKQMYADELDAEVAKDWVSNPCSCQYEYDKTSILLGVSGGKRTVHRYEKPGFHNWASTLHSSDADLLRDIPNVTFRKETAFHHNIPTNSVVYTDASDYGSSLVYHSEGRRITVFDAESRKKVDDVSRGESSLFGFVWRSKSEKSMQGHDYAMRSILWRAWHYERRNGDVSVDAFPGFTYDSKKDGRTKTSLLWRLFRKETTADGNTEMDILFIPIMR